MGGGGGGVTISPPDFEAILCVKYWKGASENIIFGFLNFELDYFENLTGNKHVMAY